jgi:hypothetical protein
MDLLGTLTYPASALQEHFGQRAQEEVLRGRVTRPATARYSYVLTGHGASLAGCVARQHHGTTPAPTIMFAPVVAGRRHPGRPSELSFSMGAVA